MSIGTRLHSQLVRNPTTYRDSILSKPKLADLLMFADWKKCETTACKIGLGSSSVSAAASEVLCAIKNPYRTELQFQTSEEDTAAIMDGFEEKRGLLYCAAAWIAHIPSGLRVCCTNYMSEDVIRCLRAP